MNLEHGSDYGHYWDDLMSGNTADFLGGTSGKSFQQQPLMAHGEIVDDEPWGFGAVTSSTSGSSTKEPEPVLDEDGQPLTREDIYEAMANLEVSRLHIDRDVRRIQDPEEQAEQAEALDDRYDRLEREYKEKLRDIERWESYQLDKIGARNYKMGTDEGNIAITEMVDDEIDWFEEEFGKLKQKLGRRIRGKLDELEAQGMSVSDKSRDCIYEDLADEEIIEAWEPLEF